MNQIVPKILGVAQRRLLWLLLCCYALAWLLPGLGVRLRDVSAGSLPWLNGGLIARAMGASAADRLTLMFGVGMTNNGTGLVLASAALPDQPEVMLPIIFYDLVQQIVAGVVDARFRRRDDRRGDTDIRRPPS